MGIININSTDIIYATLVQHGRQIAAYRLSGHTTMADLMRHLRSIAKGCMGLVNITLRNSTQGWSQARSIMFGSAESLSTPSVQLSLF